MRKPRPTDAASAEVSAPFTPGIEGSNASIDTLWESPSVHGMAGGFTVDDTTGSPPADLCADDPGSESAALGQSELVA